MRHVTSDEARALSAPLPSPWPQRTKGRLCSSLVMRYGTREAIELLREVKGRRCSSLLRRGPLEARLEARPRVKGRGGQTLRQGLSSARRAPRQACPTPLSVKACGLLPNAPPPPSRICSRPPFSCLFSSPLLVSLLVPPSRVSSRSPFSYLFSSPLLVSRRCIFLFTRTPPPAPRRTWPAHVAPDSHRDSRAATSCRARVSTPGGGSHARPSRHMRRPTRLAPGPRREEAVCRYANKHSAGHSFATRAVFVSHHARRIMHLRY